MVAALPAEASTVGHRVIAVPALGVEGLPPEQAVAAGRRRMLPAIAMVHANRRSLVTAWLRARPHGPAAVLVGGVEAPLGEDVPIAFPAGARARTVTDAQRNDSLGRLAHWVQAELSLDCTGREVTVAPGPRLEDLFALLPDRPMGLVVIARPRLRSDVRERLEDLSDDVVRLEPNRSGRGFERLRLARVEAELDYLERSGPQGLWELEVWVGAGTPAEARAVAALCGGSADVADVPLGIRPVEPTAPDDEGMAWVPRLVVGADCVAALARPPGRELPGIRVVDVPNFHLTPEVRGPIALGDVLDATKQASVPLGVPPDSINRHVFVTGATGSGKSQSVRALLAQLSGMGTPWMVIEPAKSEYARMAGRIREHGPVVVIRPGREDDPPASLNPMEPSSILHDGKRRTFPLQTHLDLVRALFTASFQAEEPFPQILAAALTRSYEELGWNLALGRALDGDPDVAPRYPTLTDVQRQALAAVDAIGYGREIRDNVQGFVRVRIDALRQGTPGRFFEGGHPLDVDALLRTNVVFEIEDLGDDHDKAFFIGNILIRVFEVLRLKEKFGLLPGGLAHVTVVEEAHRLLHNVEEGSPSAQAVRMFANLLAEVRAYGEGIIVAEQIPAKIIPDVVKNSAVKVMHRLPAADDREFVGATMNLTDEQSEVVVSLAPGVAAVHVDGMDQPILVAVDGSGAAREGVPRQRPRAPMSPRSPSCPSSCASSPCTLEHLIRSQAAALSDHLALWAEVVTLAHLLWEEVGGVARDVLAPMDQMDAERARCTLGLLADAAVDRRSAAIRRHYDPAALKRRVVTVMREQWTLGTDAPRPDPTWAISKHRWIDVRRSLASPPAGTDTSRPHPSTAAWAARGLSLAGPSWAEQAAEARAVVDRDPTEFVVALLGDPPLLPDLATRIGRGSMPSARLDTALRAAGLPHRWPLTRIGKHLPKET